VTLTTDRFPTNPGKERIWYSLFRLSVEGIHFESRYAIHPRFRHLYRNDAGSVPIQRDFRADDSISQVRFQVSHELCGRW